MPTSSFDKQFYVKPEKVEEFVNEMTKPITLTLPRDFQSQLMHEKDLKAELSRAIGKEDST